MSKLYRITDDSFPDRWVLGAPVTPTGERSNSARFTRGRPVDVAEELELVIAVVHVGRPLPFSLAVGEVPVVAPWVGSLLESLAPDEVQRIPARVEGSDDPYEVLNVLAVEDCIDPERTVGRRWRAEDGHPSPGKVGQYALITTLRLDPGRVNHKIFWVAGWAVVLAVVEEVKAALEGAGLDSAVFELVS